VNRTTKISLLTLVRDIMGLLLALILIVHGLELLFTSDLGRQYLPNMNWFSYRRIPGEYLVGLGYLSLCGPAIYWLFGRFAISAERGIVGKGTDGADICLQPSAVSRTIVREVKLNVEEVIRIRRCDVWQGSRGPVVILRISISDRAPVPVVQQKVKKVAEETLRQLIGFADASQLRVQVNEIAGAAAAPGKVRKPRKRTEEAKA
jgi:hypothetical protein